MGGGRPCVLRRRARALARLIPERPSLRVEPGRGGLGACARVGPFRLARRHGGPREGTALRVTGILRRWSEAPDGLPARHVRASLTSDAASGAARLPLDTAAIRPTLIEACGGPRAAPSQIWVFG